MAAAQKRAEAPNLVTTFGFVLPQEFKDQSRLLFGLTQMVGAWFARITLS